MLAAHQVLAGREVSEQAGLEMRTHRSMDKSWVMDLVRRGAVRLALPVQPEADTYTEYY